VRYWILDEDQTPQRLPLQRLIRQVRTVVGAAGADPVSCELLKARGYGAQIHIWEAALDETEKVVVSLDQLERLSEGNEEWFYDCDARLKSPYVRFGMHDSTALFVEAEQSIATPIASAFSNIRVATD
jgi:hypothetical protein